MIAASGCWADASPRACSRPATLATAVFNVRRWARTCDPSPAPPGGLGELLAGQASQNLIDLVVEVAASPGAHQRAVSGLLWVWGRWPAWLGRRSGSGLRRWPGTWGSTRAAGSAACSPSVGVPRRRLAGHAPGPAAQDELTVGGDRAMRGQVGAHDVGQRERTARVAFGSADHVAIAIPRHGQRVDREQLIAPRFLQRGWEQSLCCFHRDRDLGVDALGLLGQQFQQLAKTRRAGTALSRLLIRPTWWPGRCRQSQWTSHSQRHATRQIVFESHRITGTEPGGPPPRSTATTLTDHSRGWCASLRGRPW